MAVMLRRVNEPPIYPSVLSAVPARVKMGKGAEVAASMRKRERKGKNPESDRRVLVDETMPSQRRRDRSSGR